MIAALQTINVLMIVLPTTVWDMPYSSVLLEALHIYHSKLSFKI
jgi:hypothetical protein